MWERNIDPLLLLGGLTGARAHGPEALHFAGGHSAQGAPLTRVTMRGHPEVSPTLLLSNAIPSYFA